jgi:hypothetical protein
VLLELLNGLAVVGIGVLLFPILRQHNENIARGYLSLRIVEAVFCWVIVICPLSLIRFGREAAQAGTAAAAGYQAISNLSLAERAGVAGLLVPVFFSLGALLFYYAVFQARRLPRFISVWGLIAAMLILINNLWSQFAVIPTGFTVVLSLPIILNEIFLGIWLIGKGFNPPPSAARPGKTEPNELLSAA